MGTYQTNHNHYRSQVAGDTAFPNTYVGTQNGNFIGYANQIKDDNKQGYLSTYLTQADIKPKDGYYRVDEYPCLWEWYCDKKVADIGTVYKPAGSLSLTDILALDTTKIHGNVYNVSDLGKTGGVIPADKSPNNKKQEGVMVGDQILVDENGYLDKLSGFVDLNPYQTKTIDAIVPEKTNVVDTLKWLYQTQRYTGGTGITISKTNGSDKNGITWTVNNTGVLSITQDQTDGHKLTINTGGTSSTITIPDNTTITAYGSSDAEAANYYITNKDGSKVQSLKITKASNGSGVGLKAGNNITFEESSAGFLRIIATDTKYSTFTNTAAGLVPAGGDGKTDCFLNAAGEWAQLSMTATNPYRILTTDTNNKYTDNQSNNIWNSTNPPGTDGHKYAGNLIMLANNGNLCRAVLTTYNNIHKKFSDGNDLYLSGPEITASSTSQIDSDYANRYGYTSDYIRKLYLHTEDVVEDGNTPAHKKFRFYMWDAGLVNLATSGPYVDIHEVGDLSWRMREGVGRMYNWGHNGTTFTGLKTDGDVDQLATRFNRAWMHGCYGSYSLNNLTSILRIGYCCNASKGWWHVPIPSFDDKLQYPLKTDDSTAPSGTSNTGIIYDKRGIFKTEGTNGCYYTIGDGAAVASEITKTDWNLIFYYEHKPAEITLSTSFGPNGKLELGDLSDYNIVETTEGSGVYRLIPNKNPTIEWDNAKEGKKNIDLRVVILPTYFYSSLNTFTYNKYQVMVYGKLKDESTYESVSITGHVRFSQQPSLFLTNYSGLPFVDSWFNSPTWTGTAWSKTTFTAKYATNDGDWKSHDKPSVSDGDNGWREDSSSTTDREVYYINQTYFCETKTTSDHRPKSGSAIAVKDSVPYMFLDIKGWKIVQYTTDSSGKRTSTTTITYDAKAYKVENTTTSNVETGTYTSVDTAITELAKKSSINLTIAKSNRYDSGYERYYICCPVDEYKAPGGDVTGINFTSSKTTIYKPDANGTITLPDIPSDTITVTCWDEGEDTKTTFEFYVKK